MQTGKAVPVRHKTVGHVSVFLGILVFAVTGTVLRGDRGIQGGDGEIVSRNPVPDVCLQAGCRRKQLILEQKSVCRRIEGQLCQFRFRQKRQRQVSLIFQQGGLSEMILLRKEGAGFVLIIPVNHIFQSQEQIRHGRTFFKGISIIGIFRAVTQRLHKQRGLHIGGTGESGNTVIVIQRSVIEGLGMGGFCTVEQVIALPFLHVPDDRCRVFRTLWIIGSIGSRKIQTETDQIGNQFHPHDRQQQTGRPAAVSLFLLPYPGNLFFRGILRNRLLHASGQHCQQIQHQKHQIVQEIQGNIQGKTSQFPGYRGRQFLRAGKHTGCQNARQQNLPG